MADELSGMSFLLKQKIDRLECEIELVRKALGPEAIQERRAQDLKELRRELEQELTSKRVVLFGTQHSYQEKGHEKNFELEQRLSYLIDKFAITVMLEARMGERLLAVIRRCLSESKKYSLRKRRYSDNRAVPDIQQSVNLFSRP